VSWVLGDTTDTINNLVDGRIDVGITYCPSAEARLVETGVALERAYAFRDHFLLVGPKCVTLPGRCEKREELRANDGSAVDPILQGWSRGTACTSSSTTWSALGMRQRFVPPDTVLPTSALMTRFQTPPTKFLSRYDKSATNIKESEIFIAIGQVSLLRAHHARRTWRCSSDPNATLQVPWAHSHSRWYHQFTDFPRQALIAAAHLEEYTLTNRDAALSAAPEVLARFEIYNEGGNEDPADPLLNPAAALLGAKARDMELARMFMHWLVQPDGGQRVVRTFERNGFIIYSEAPRPGQSSKAHGSTGRRN